MIVANSGNEADLFDPPTPGPTGINVNNGFGFSPIAGTLIRRTTSIPTAVVALNSMPVRELTDDLDVLVLEFLGLLGQAIKTGVGRVHSSKVIQFAMPKAKEKP